MEDSLVKMILPISEYTSLLAIVIGISKFLFNTDWISLCGVPVAFKILFNSLVVFPLFAKFFKDSTVTVRENTLYIIFIFSAALTLGVFSKNWLKANIKTTLENKFFENLISYACASCNFY